MSKEELKQVIQERDELKRLLRIAMHLVWDLELNETAYKGDGQPRYICRWCDVGYDDKQSACTNSECPAVQARKLLGETP